MTAPHFRTRVVFLNTQPIRRHGSRLGIALSVLGLLALLVGIGINIATTQTPQERLDQHISDDFRVASLLLERCQAVESSCPTFYAYYNGTLKPDVADYRGKMYASGNAPSDDLVIGDISGRYALHQLNTNDPLIVLAIHGEPQ